MSCSRSLLRLVSCGPLSVLHSRGRGAQRIACGPGWAPSGAGWRASSLSCLRARAASSRWTLSHSGRKGSTTAPRLFEDAGDAADLVRIFLDHTVFESPAAELEDMEALEAQFEALSLCDYRVLYQGRDLELECLAALQKH